MMLHFATLFDSNYLSRGLALLESLQQHTTDSFHLYVLALDEKVEVYFAKTGYKHVTTIPLHKLEEFYSELVTAKGNRSKIEYYFTLSPFLPSYILHHYKVDRITTLDSDLYFFGDPQAIFDTYPGASVLITPHHFSDRLRESEIYGKYNVSFQSFRNDERGSKCLEKWRKQCGEWCYDYLDEINGRFADQKYLDGWTKELEGVQSIDIPGTGLAPWNLDTFSYRISGKQLLVNDHALIYFHYHHLRIFNTHFAINAFEEYNVKTRHKAVKKIYQHYLQRLRKISDQLKQQEASQLRYKQPDKKTLISKLMNTNGYWFYSSWFIFYLNPLKSILKIKYRLKKIYGSITKLNYVHR